MRGMRVAVYGDRIYSAASGATVSSTDSRSVEVMGPWGGSTSNAATDITHITTDGQKLFAVVAVGGVGAGGSDDLCAMPTRKSWGCYRTLFAELTPASGDPLVYRGFNAKVAREGLFPSNASQYTRVVYPPNSGPRLMTMLLGLQGPDQKSGSVTPAGPLLFAPNAEVSSFIPQTGP